MFTVNIYSSYDYYKPIDKKTQKLRMKYEKYGISALINLNAPIILDENIIKNHKQYIKNYGFLLPDNALFFGRSFYDHSYIYYGVGGFDCWCVFLVYWDRFKCKWVEVVPKDSEYFEIIVNLGKAYRAENIWRDFYKIYLRTSSQVNTDVFREIHELSEKYQQSSLLVEQTLSIIYLAMVSEENKILSFDEFGNPRMTKLGKTIKALGIFQILFENKSPDEAANFSKNPEGGWRNIASICKKCGIERIYTN